MLRKLLMVFIVPKLISYLRRRYGGASAGRPPRY